MKLPINHEDAIKEWARFEDYLVQERYAVRDPKLGQPIENNLAQVLKRISGKFSYPGISKALQDGQFITATPFLMNGGNPYTQRKGYYSCYPLGNVEDSTEAIFDMEWLGRQGLQMQWLGMQCSQMQ